MALDVFISFDCDIRDEQGYSTVLAIKSVEFQEKGFQRHSVPY